VGEKLVGATVGQITQRASRLQVVLQALRGGKGKGQHKFKLQPKIEQYAISGSIRNIMNTIIVKAKQNSNIAVK
jgi:hypothetical protein